MHPIHFRKNGGEHKSESFLNINAQGLLPVWSDGVTHLSQSLAIIEYIDSEYPICRLIPNTPLEKAQVNAIAQVIACDMHPLNNLRVLQYLENNFGITEEQKRVWVHHWLREGFEALEIMMTKLDSKKFCFGDSISLADVCLVPQVYNAERFGYDMSNHPRLAAITSNLRQIKAFDNAKPELQIDAEC